MNSPESAEEVVRGLEKGTLSLEFVQELVERFSGNKEHVWQELERHMRTL